MIYKTLRDLNLCKETLKKYNSDLIFKREWLQLCIKKGKSINDILKANSDISVIKYDIAKMNRKINRLRKEVQAFNDLGDVAKNERGEWSND